MFSTTEPIVLVPGLRGHVTDHWQTYLERTLPGAVSVIGLGSRYPSLDDRVALLNNVIQDMNRPVTIVAHSAGVLTTVHWAARHDGPVVGALLVTPPDLCTELPPAYPRLAELRANGWLPIPQQTLSFPSIVAASTNDALGDHERVRAMADAWGARFHSLGPVGHLNPASGYGVWSGAEQLLAQLATVSVG